MPSASPLSKYHATPNLSQDLLCAGKIFLKITIKNLNPRTITLFHENYVIVPISVNLLLKTQNK